MSDYQHPITSPDLPIYVSEMDKRRVQLYERGGWFHTTGDKLAGHFFMMAREDSDIAISMCATIIAPVDELHPTGEGARCMVCELYELAGKGGDYAERQARRKQHAERVLKLHEARQAAKEAAKKSRK